MTTRLGALASSLDVDQWTRAKDRAAAFGLKGEPLPPYAATGGVPTTQVVYGIADYFYVDEVVTNIVVSVTLAAAGTAPTSLKLGLWSSAATPVCLAVTADLASDARWTFTGWKENALSSPYTILASGIHYLAFWINGVFATTNVQLAISAVSGTFGREIGANARRSASLKSPATTMAVSETGTYGILSNMPFLGWN